MKISKSLPAIAAALLGAAPVAAFTTADEVRPILEATRGNWIAVREYEGQDLLYFTHLASFRCGLSEIRYGVNSDLAILPFVPEPCYREEAAPNALKMENGELPYVAFPLGQVQSVTVTIIYGDGSEATAQYDRAAIKMP